jgi:hypothetical protein
VTSNINYLSINQNFPVAGEDNDTQTFRDNFDTIRTSLQAGQEEITALQANTAKTNDNNDFEDNEISRVVFRDVMDRRFDGGIIALPTTLLTVDYENGGYQVFRFNANMDIDFQNFPENSGAGGPIGCGRMTLELYGDDIPRNLSLKLSGSTKFRLGGVTSGITKISDVQINFTITSQTEPKIFEIWRHSSTYMFVNYLGNFS